MPNISASDYTTFIKYQAASLGYQNGAIPANRHNNVQIAPTQSIMNAQLLASKASYLTQTQSSSSVTVPDTFTLANGGGGSGSIYSSSTDPPAFSFLTTGVANTTTIAYNGKAFCNGIKYSTDNGATWQSTGIPVITICNSIFWSSGLNMWIASATGDATNELYYFTGPIPSGTWTPIAKTSFSGVNGVMQFGASNGNIVVITALSNSNTPEIYYSTGSSLSFSLATHPLTTSGYQIKLACDGDTGTWIAVGQGLTGTIARVTSNGVNGTWTATTSGTNGFTAGYSVCFANGIWVAGGFYGTYNISYSTDGGVNWTAVTSPFNGNTSAFVNSICWNGTEFVAAGRNNTLSFIVAYSKDGVTWSTVSGFSYTNNIEVASHLVLPYTAAKNTALVTTTASTKPSSVITGLNYVRPFAGKGYVNHPKSLSTVTYAGSGTTSSSKTYQAGGPPSGKGNTGKVITLYNGRS